MKKSSPLLLFALLLLLSTTLYAQKLTDYVNPFVGTDYHGHTFPGATYPFGMVQLSPDTRIDTWDGCSGYHHSDSVILGFSHTHLNGTGCSDLGDILFMPTVNYPDGEIIRQNYSSTFSHLREKASPGFYEVFLDRCNILAQLTVGKRIGMHRYIYPEGVNPQLVIDLEHRDILLGWEIKVIGDRIIEGYRRSEAWAVDQMVCFHIKFSRPITAYRNNRKNSKILLTFAPEKGINNLLVKIGISSVSPEGARKNLLSEIPLQEDWEFEKLFSSTEKAWNDYLGKIRVSPDSTFYTALYHTAISPCLYSDANGLYRGMDKKIYRSERPRYTIFSLWDTYRALHPLFTLIERERTIDFIDSFLSIYKEAGKLPIWELWRNETNCMIGYHSVSVIADAIAADIVDFDIPTALEAMVASSKKEEFGIGHFHRDGAVLAEKEHESVSKTLEYAYDDWCISQVAQHLFQSTRENHYKELADNYLHYAQFYRNIFDPSTGFMRSRLNGRMLTPFRPEEVNNHFTEANSWQYSFYVPQDIEGHIALLGGDSAYCDKIDALFSASNKTTGRDQVDITGLIGQYAHGNEPSHHIPFLYNYAGQCWKSQEMVHRILSELYHSGADGLCGNDDCGQMSAWYVLSALGLYSVTPGSGIWTLSSPLFDEAVISLENGKHFTITRSDNSIYIHSLKLNGDDYPYSYLKVDDIIAGGSLSFELGQEPNYSFGSAREHRPRSFISSSDFVPNPWFVMENNIFLDSMRVSIAVPDTSLSIAYEVLRSSDDSLLLSGSCKSPQFTITDNCTLSAYAFDDHSNRSFTTTSSLNRIRQDCTINTLSEYNPQYNAGGERGLIDGVRGTTAWRTGGWQGFQDTDFEAIIDLLDVKQISSIGAGFCQDARSWIWMPRFVEFAISSDGTTFTSVGRIENRIDPQDYTLRVHDFVLDLTTSSAYGNQPISCRYIKVFAKNFGTIPAWHLGSGGEGFIFIDEIFFKP